MKEKYFTKREFILLALLLIGSIFYTFSSGKFNVLIFAYIYPVFFLIFSHFNKRKLLFIIPFILIIIGNSIKWDPINDEPGFMNIVVAGTYALIKSIPYIIEHFTYKIIKGFKSTLILPLAYVSLDLILLLTPLSNFGNIASTQSSFLPLIQTASLFGSLSITFLVIWFSSIIVYVLELLYKRENKRKTILPISLYSSIFVGLMIFGSIRISTSSNNPTIKIAYTTVMNQSSKDITIPLINSYLSKASLGGADMLVFNEEAFKVKESEETDFLESIKISCNSNNIYTLITYKLYVDEVYHYNKLALVNNNKEIVFEYNKTHLVPESESDVIKGDNKIPNKIVTLPSGVEVKLASVICMDSDFIHYVLNGMDNDSGLLIIPTWDWEAIDNYHTFNIIYRGIENGCNLIRVTHDGYSSISDHLGRITTFTNSDDYDGSEILYSQAKFNSEFTLYKYIGPYFDWLYPISLLGLVTYGIVNFCIEKRKQKANI